jgi:hypothetical protein
VQVADQAADFFFGGRGRAAFPRIARIWFQIATRAESVEQKRGEALKIGGLGGGMFLRLRDGLWVAREFIKADGYGLTEVHGAMLFASGNAQEPIAVAEVFIRKAALFRTEKKGDPATGEMLAEQTGGVIETADRVLQLPGAHGSGSDNERAIGYGIRDSFELFGLGKQRRSPNSGTRLAKSQFIGIHYAKMEEAEVAHGAGGGTDVERIARGDKHDPQAVGFGVG